MAHYDRLEDEVKWMVYQGCDTSYHDDKQEAAQSYVEDIQRGGCQSGTVSELIYTKDCIEFYMRYRQEIDKMAYELMTDCGCGPEMFTDWDKDDPFARDDYNQTILAWFGFEETVHRLTEYEDYKWDEYDTYIDEEE